MLVMLPTFILVSYTIFLLVTKGARGMDELVRPSSKLERFRSRHRIAYYGILSSYSLLVLAAVWWMYLEVIAPSEGLPLIGMVLVAGLMSAELVVVSLWSIGRIRRALGRIPPRPESGSPSAVMSEWQSRYMEEFGRDLFDRDFLRLALAEFGIFVVFAALLIVVALTRN